MRGVGLHWLASELEPAHRFDGGGSLGFLSELDEGISLAELRNWIHNQLIDKDYKIQ